MWLLQSTTAHMLLPELGALVIGRLLAEKDFPQLLHAFSLASHISQTIVPFLNGVGLLTVGFASKRSSQRGEVKVTILYYKVSSLRGTFFW